MQDRIFTAGSCFAQHLARHVSANGFNYFCTESGHEAISPELKKSLIMVFLALDLAIFIPPGNYYS